MTEEHSRTTAGCGHRQSPPRECPASGKTESLSRDRGTPLHSANSSGREVRGESRVLHSVRRHCLLIASVRGSEDRNQGRGLQIQSPGFSGTTQQLAGTWPPCVIYKRIICNKPAMRMDELNHPSHQRVWEPWQLGVPGGYPGAEMGTAGHPVEGGSPASGEATQGRKSITQKTIRDQKCSVHQHWDPVLTKTIGHTTFRRALTLIYS